MEFIKYLFYCVAELISGTISGSFHASDKDLLVGGAVCVTLLIVLLGTGMFFCLKTDFPLGKSIIFALLVTSSFIIIVSVVCIIVEKI